MVMALPPMRDSAVSPCFHGCPAFLHGHFPPQSPPPCPLNLSLCSQKQPSPRDCTTIPKLQLPSTVRSGVCMAAARPVWFSFHFSSVQFSRSVVFDSLQPHGLQHTRHPCPSPTPGVYTNSRPLSWWCHPIISFSVGLKLTIQKTKIMASHPITSWQIDRETVETVTDFIF